MQQIEELAHHAAPAGRPQPIAFQGNTLWVGCWDTSHLYAIDPATWTVTASVPAPGKPFGMAFHDGALRIVISLGEDDDRYIVSYDPASGFDSEIACPDRTGSHLLSDGDTLYLVQQTHGRMVAIDAAGTVLREIVLPSRCGGGCFVDGTFYLISADADFDVLHFATLDLDSDEPELVELARVSVEARGLAYDGSTFWTCYRELNELVSFALAKHDEPAAAP